MDEQHLDHSAIDTDKAYDLAILVPANRQVRDGCNRIWHIGRNALDIIRREKRVRCLNRSSASRRPAWLAGRVVAKLNVFDAECHCAPSVRA